MTNWYLDIYGVGALESECRRIEKEFPEHVTFHGRGDAHTLNQKLSTTNYCLMPSLIIETF